jgi:circadian clock protein KaiC
LALSHEHNGPNNGRLATGVRGMDEVLVGGMVRRSEVFIVGGPGTGKTTLGSQLAFAHASEGGSILFATALAEAHDQMIANLSGFDFFERSFIGSRIYCISLYDELREHGPPGVLRPL